MLGILGEKSGWDEIWSLFKQFPIANEAVVKSDVIVKVSLRDEKLGEAIFFIDLRHESVDFIIFVDASLDDQLAKVCVLIHG